MTAAPAAASGPIGLAATPLWSVDLQREVRERSIFESGKLDPQIFDAPALAPFALRLAPSAWRALSTLAEAAWRELADAETALLADPASWTQLGIPRRLRKLLAGSPAELPQARFARIDFHPTPDGWRVSEINADVPGGFIEAGPLTRTIASYHPGLSVPPNPAAALASSVARAIERTAAHGDVALVHATSYADDQQVLRCIADELESLGLAASFAAPDHPRWDADRGSWTLATTGRSLAAIVRFFPAEWLANLPAHTESLSALTQQGLIHANPIRAVLLQSKRLPIALQARGIRTPVWSSLLPPVSPVRCADLLRQSRRADPVLKPVWGRVGEGVCVRGVTSRTHHRRSVRSAMLRPHHWIWQERFQSLPIRHPCGPVHACLGVYVIDGVASGVYARVASTPLIDATAQDAAVLLDPSLDPPTPERKERADAA